jgi:hypothetical protein
MANKKFLFGMWVLVLAFWFVLTGCDNGNNSDSKIEVYKGTSDGTEYTLTIRDGSIYELKVGSKLSSGSVESNSNFTFILKPSGSETTFTVMVSSSGITGMNGTITFTDNSTVQAPSSVTPGEPSSESTPFEGAWKGWNGDGSSEKIWVFNGNEFTAIINGNYNAKGTFTYTATTITITATHQWNGSSWEPWSYVFELVPYEISGTNLTLTGDGNGQPFVKGNWI